ncbi:hypothetical protein [Nocardia macrotermitis]|uniref:Uncharacterized protein n=1 Tax=Nocardia macrotermitis TaxID=2585198 RepID=A0A7K0DBI8_9NOCA|nr:hypothetical protein [Nocardia macrotermitis]MQY22662.1 hypothetical protein [Nocardia macrotermitis]
MIEPVLIAIANSLAGKATGALYDLVRKKFAASRHDTATLEAAAGVDERDPQIARLAEALERAETDDSEFGTRLRAEWAQVCGTVRSGDGAVTNDISGTVSGNAVQARDIQGGINF